MTETEELIQHARQVAAELREQCRQTQKYLAESERKAEAERQKEEVWARYDRQTKLASLPPAKPTAMPTTLPAGTTTYEVKLQMAQRFIDDGKLANLYAQENGAEAYSKIMALIPPSQRRRTK